MASSSPYLSLKSQLSQGQIAFRHAAVGRVMHELRPVGRGCGAENANKQEREKRITGHEVGTQSSIQTIIEPTVFHTYVKN